MKKEKDLYDKLMYHRPRKIYQTYNAINRSNNILYTLCEKELRRIQTRGGWHTTIVTVYEAFVACTKYSGGKYSVEVTPRTYGYDGETTTITGARAKIIYDRAKQYCR